MTKHSYNVTLVKERTQHKNANISEVCKPRHMFVPG